MHSKRYPIIILLLYSCGKEICNDSFESVHLTKKDKICIPKIPRLCIRVTGSLLPKIRQYRIPCFPKGLKKAFRKKGFARNLRLRHYANPLASPLRIAQKHLEGSPWKRTFFRKTNGITRKCTQTFSKTERFLTASRCSWTAASRGTQRRRPRWSCPRGGR